MRKWAGVDVGGRTKAFHLAFVDDELRITLDRARSAADCVDALVRRDVRAIAIDAPSSWAPDGELSRPCERAFARTGLCRIRFTPDAATAAAHAGDYYEWIELGLELWAASREAGLEVIEGFPTASWTAWLGPRERATRAGWTRRGIEALGRDGVGELGPVGNQDERDAVAAALTARQWERRADTTERFGDLVVPRRDTWPFTAPPRSAEWGVLADGASAPVHGETTFALARGRAFRVEQILSGALAGAQHYVQPHDEWVVVIDGSATLEVDGVVRGLERGDWCFLPAGLPHQVLRAEPGTSWIAVRSP